MYIYYETNNNQVRAKYSGNPSSQKFEGLGYVKAEIPVELEDSVSLDVAVVIEGGKITGVAPFSRPVLSLSKTFLIADGVDEITVSPSFPNGQPEDCTWSIERKPEIGDFGAETDWMKDVFVGPELVFSTEILGHYLVRCVSETFGISRIAIEVKDA